MPATGRAGEPLKPVRRRGGQLTICGGEFRRTPMLG